MGLLNLDRLLGDRLQPFVSLSVAVILFEGSLALRYKEILGTLVFFTFAVSYMLYTGSGVVTVTVVGIWLANMRDVDVDEILNFKESLSILLISLLFILLGCPC